MQKIQQTLLSLVLPGLLVFQSGCIGTAQHGTELTAITDTPTPAQFEARHDQLPTFPGLYSTGKLSATHTTSTTETPVPGDSFLDDHGENNREDNGIEALIIIPGAEDDLAWGVYNLGGLTDDRPININLDVAAAPLLPGGDDPLPLNFWVGLSNYTQFSWEWFGPFDESQSILMNSETFRDRYVNQDSVMYFSIVTESADGFVTPQNPDGLTAAQINVSTVSAETATSPAYNATKPLFVPIENHAASSLPPKDSSDHGGPHHVELDWSHFNDWRSPGSSSTEYQVFRTGPGETEPTRIGTVTAPASSFTDPPATPIAPEPEPGSTYRYFLRGHNDHGSSARDFIDATIPVLNWTHAWGGANTDVTRDICITPEGNIYTVGVTRSFGQGGNDLLMLGYDKAGNLTSRFVWGDTADESANDICCDDLGNKYVTGRTLSLTGTQEVILLKFDNLDNLVWAKSWNAPGSDSSSGLAVACDPAGNNIYVTGQSTQTGLQHTLLLKFDGLGILDWQTRWIGTGGGSTGNDIAVDANGNVYITGYATVDTRGTDALLLKFDNSGDLDWEKAWGTTQSEEGLGLELDGAGNVYLAGYTNIWPFVIRVDSTALLTAQNSWVTGFGTSGQCNAVEIKGNKLYAAGDWTGDVLLLEYDLANLSLSGDWLWQGSAAESVYGLAVTDSYLTFTGNAADNTITLSDVMGTETAPGGDLIDSGGTQNVLTGGAFDIGPFVTAAPAGTVDSGGGGADSLIIQWDVSSGL